MVLQHDLAARQALRRERVYRDRMDPFAFSDNYLLRHYKLPRQELLNWCDRLEPLVGRATRRSHAVPVRLSTLSVIRHKISDNNRYTVP